MITATFAGCPYRAGKRRRVGEVREHLTRNGTYVTHVQIGHVMAESLIGGKLV
ncbi:MAG: hypothetical protein ACP5QR_03800 [Rhizomicrobium sp.]